MQKVRRSSSSRYYLRQNKFFYFSVKTKDHLSHLSFMSFPLSTYCALFWDRSRRQDLCARRIQWSHENEFWRTVRAAEESMGDDTVHASATIGRERGRPARQDLHRRRLQRPGSPRLGGGLRRGDQSVDQHQFDDQPAIRRLFGRLS